MVILRARGLHFRYPGGITGLDGLEFSLLAGETLAILGANGAGKTTLLLHLNGSLRPQRGEITLDDRALRYNHAALNAWRAAVGSVMQDPDDQLFAGTVFEDISFGPLNLGLPDAVVHARVVQAMDDLDIAELADRPIHMLSLGQKRRVAIAGVLAMRPRVLLLDEPTAGLDPQGVTHLLTALRRLSQEGTTIAYATHDVDLALAWSDRVALFTDGRTIACDAPERLLADEVLLRNADLRRPVLLNIAQQLRQLGLIGADEALPRTSSELIEALARCGGRASPHERALGSAGASIA